jgi:hypothetical protein
MYIHAYTYRQTPTGWINNQEFKDAIFQKLIPHINVTREKLQGRRALLLLDGHSTCLQREIWVELNKKKYRCAVHTCTYFQFHTEFGSLRKWAVQTIARECEGVP